jgi:hypothetical protein
MTEQTETVDLEYGAVEIDVIKCDSCGNTVAPEDAKPFTLDGEEGHACTLCAEEGPIFANLEDDLLRYQGYFKDDADLRGVIEFLVVSPLLAGVAMSVMPFYPFDDDELDSDMALLGATAWGVAMWAVAVLGVYVVLF